MVYLTNPFAESQSKIAQSSDKIIQPRMQLMLELSSCGEALALPITQGAPPCLEHGKTWQNENYPAKFGERRQKLKTCKMSKKNKRLCWDNQDYHDLAIHAFCIG